VLKLVDSFTSATCHPGTADPAGLKGPLVTEPFSCAVQADKEICENGGGSCEMLRDGYYTVNMLCVIFGIVTFLWYIQPKVLHLRNLPLKAWRLAGPKS
jgi:PAT family acetyl-CoA transporter-like MFS transporter 1